MNFGVGCLDDNVLAGYIDGNLQGDQLNGVEGHLANCPVCLGRLIEARASMSVEMVEVPSAIRQRVKDLVGAADAPVEIWSWPWLELLLRPGRALGLAMCSMMIIMACFTGMQFGETICEGIWFSVELGNNESGGII